MPKISKVHASKGLGGYYFDDLHAIKAGAKRDGFFYVGTPMVPRQFKVRQPGESISIMLELDSGEVAFGDAVAIQYSGVVGRDPVLLADEFAPHVARYIAPALEGRELSSLRELGADLEALKTEDGHQIHTGLRYGASQAVLHALALHQHRTMAEVAADEYDTVVSASPIPVLAQSGDDRYDGADKMILKSVPAITQGLFNSVEKIGEKGEVLLGYVEWLRERVLTFGEEGYAPVFHLDVYGMPGRIFNDDVDQIADYFDLLAKAASPFSVRFEAPVDLGSRDGTMDKMVALRTALRERDSSVQICADDWCNTLADVKQFAEAGAADMIQVKAPDLGSITNSAAAVQACKANGVAAFLGGTCNGTDQSSRVTANLALALQADLIYNKPGMGVDEGLMIVVNEMNRVLTLAGTRR
ncbi:methylaspartate ammonia-lyase [Mycolicibacterium neoaurum]|uniref:methylaspartate ammonia-lyase n=1 Tax=Mycolicibacterium neoaurum TaxID=1795 RepID=UPI00248AD371|nr:methylaspartate ammonia-lyase [Mycolicibacterium neoaurum]WBP93348.1 methylaspartate ammonia-lyase [Mycolicibacterium neoaurum]WBS06976.1 methylaspartate ammonia-lyase [Mycolicibacterium neoaurum]